MNGLSGFEQFSVVVVLVSALAWLLRLEGAVRNNAQRHDDFVTSHDALHVQLAAAANQRFDSMSKTLDRIENKMDAALMAAAKEA